MTTTLYLIRPGAAAASGPDQPLAPLGVRQAEATRDLLAVRPVDACYSSPDGRSVQTAAVVAEPHGLAPTALDELADAASAVATIESLLAEHAGQSLVVVASHAVTRCYLAGLLGLGAEQARQVTLDPGGISVAVRREGRTTVSMLNVAFHLQGVAA